MSKLEFPKGHPIHEVSLHGKDAFGHLPTKQPNKRIKKEKPTWVLKHRSGKKYKYWYISYLDGMVSLIIGPMLSDAEKYLWEIVVGLLNKHKVEAIADLSMFGID